MLLFNDLIQNSRLCNLEADDHNFKVEKYLPGSFNTHQLGG